MNDDLDEIKRRKMEQLKKQYLNRGNIMEENMPSTPINMTDADIDGNIGKYQTVVVDCWAPWCGPCRMVGPIVEDLAREMKGKIVFGKLNVDENQATSTKYGIMSIPTLLVFKNGELVENGELVDRIVGAMPKDALKAKLTPYE